jgi:hypothetical protein
MDEAALVDLDPGGVETQIVRVRPPSTMNRVSGPRLSPIVCWRDPEAADEVALNASRIVT